MIKAITDNTKRRGRPKTTGTGTLIGVRLLPEHLARVDAWISRQREPLSRPEAIRQLIAIALQAPITFEKELGELQDELASIDLHTRRPRNVDPFTTFLIVKELQAIRIRIDGSRNHRRPHVHVDYGKERHVASYAIDTGGRLAGSLDTKYDKSVRTWVKTHKSKLLEAWEAVQGGKNIDELVCELRGELG